MANEERGEVELVAGERSYTLVLSMNAICEMQARTKKTYGELLKSATREMDVMALRDIVWMTLKKYHAKDFPSADKVGDLIDEGGGYNAALSALNRLFRLNQANAEKAERDTHPPTAQGLTGDSST